MPDRNHATDDGHRTILHAGPAPAPRPEQRLLESEVSGARRLGAVSPSQSSDPGRLVVSSADAITPGAVLAGTRYRIVRKLGDGGMGTVYEAEHIDIERKVALKVLRPEYTKTPEMVEQFRGEARAASKVGSEFIAQVFDFAELPDGSVMFTMELVDGPTLRDELRTGPMAPARVIGLLRQLCKGLDAAHAAGVVHRDVKPDNIVIEHRRGRADAIKILDFGIAAMIGEDRHVVAAGTPHYTAPEIVAGTKFDSRADVYAVGCTAYEMLVGRPPFGQLGGDVAAVLGSHLAETPVAPSEARPELGLSAVLDDVVLRCLAKLPSNRFRTMAELEAALCVAQIDAAMQTSWDDLPLPDGVDPVLRERLLREMPEVGGPLPTSRRGGWWPAAIVLALVAGGVGTYAWVSGRQPAIEQPSLPSAVDALVADARGAAARSAYVYPAEDGGDAQATAFTKVRELEAMGEPDAVAAAARLRGEFTETLVNLGDSFWDREGGRRFAVEYYRQALLFDRDHPHAKSRAELGGDALDDLTRKAEVVAFSPQEIAAAAPLRRESDRVHVRGGQQPDAASGADADAVARADVPAEAPLPPLPAQVGADERSGAADLVKGAAKLLAGGRVADADEMYRRALTYDPNNLAALAAMYGIVARRGDHDAALEFAERMVANAPQRAQSHLFAGDAAFALGEIEDARRSWGRAAALGSKPAGKKLAKLEATSPRPVAAEVSAAEDEGGDASPSAETPDAKPGTKTELASAADATAADDAAVD